MRIDTDGHGDIIVTPNGDDGTVEFHLRSGAVIVYQETNGVLTRDGEWIAKLGDEPTQSV